MSGEEMFATIQLLQSVGETALLAAAVLFGLGLTLVFLILKSGEAAKHKGHSIRKETSSFTPGDVHEAVPPKSAVWPQSERQPQPSTSRHLRNDYPVYQDLSHR